MGMSEDVQYGIKEARTPMSKRKKANNIKSGTNLHEEKNQIDSSGYTSAEMEKLLDGRRQKRNAKRTAKLNKMNDDEFMKEMQ